MFLGNEDEYRLMASTGNPAFKAFWKRLQEQPEEYTVRSIGEGIERMMQTRTVFHANEGQITGYLL